jgi:hypothetical protein
MTGSAAPPSAADHPRRGLCAYASCVALSAYGGAIGLATGNLDLGHELNQRLPLHSPVLGGIALALVVGLPATVVAGLAKLGDRRTDVASIGAGVLLVAWILVELTFIRELSFLQFLYAGAGAAFIIVGRRARATTYRRSDASYPSATPR